LEEQAKGDEWACAAPRMLVDSFAAEFSLKCLFVLDTNSTPKQGHDLQVLFDELKPYTKTAK
jgi:hypothetical protein